MGRSTGTTTPQASGLTRTSVEQVFKRFSPRIRYARGSFASPELRQPLYSTGPDSTSTAKLDNDHHVPASFSSLKYPGNYLLAFLHMGRDAGPESTELFA